MQIVNTFAQIREQIIRYVATMKRSGYRVGPNILLVHTSKLWQSFYCAI